MKLYMENEYKKFVIEDCIENKTVVCVINIIVGDFSVYWGKNTQIEGMRAYRQHVYDVAAHGDKMNKKEAERLFPVEFAEYRWRD